VVEGEEATTTTTLNVNTMDPTTALSLFSALLSSADDDVQAVSTQAFENIFYTKYKSSLDIFSEFFDTDCIDVSLS